MSIFNAISFLSLLLNKYLLLKLVGSYNWEKMLIIICPQEFSSKENVKTLEDLKFQFVLSLECENR
jgi:hypothetical protein